MRGSILILAAAMAIFLLVAIKAILLPLALVTILVVIGVAAWRLDRARGAGAAAPHRDANRPDLYGRSGDSTWEVPTAYIDHPTGAGEPPGVARGDEPAPRR